MADEHSDEWKERIDTDVRGLVERLAGVEAGVIGLGKSFDQFSHSFEISKDRQQDLQKTRWPVVFGVLAVITTVMTAFMSGYLRDLNRVERSVISIQSNRRSEADPVQNKDIQLLRERAKQTEVGLLRLDKQRQTHQREGHQDIRARVEDIDAEVVGIRAEEHTSIARDASMIERIRGLERRVFGEAGGSMHDAETHHED